MPRRPASPTPVRRRLTAWDAMAASAAFLWRPAGPVATADPPLAGDAAPAAHAAPEAAAAGIFDEVHALLADRCPLIQSRGIDWEQVRRDLRPRAAAARDDAALAEVLVELVARLQDVDASLLPGRRAVPRPRPRVFGPGISCLVDARGRLAIYEVIAASPAAAADLQPGDVIRSIDGRPAAEALEAAISRRARRHGHPSERARRHDAARSLFLAEEPTRAWTLRVERPIERPDQGPAGVREVEVFAMMQPPEPRRSPVQLAGIPAHAPVSWGILDGDIGYIAVRRGGGALRSIRTAMREVVGTRALIIDVRGHAGGDFDPLDSFVPFERPADAPPWPIAVLVDPGTRGGGERWASWFVGRDRVRVFGEATAGSASVTEDVEIAGGRWRVRIPVGTDDGFLARPIEGRGLEPDVAVRPLAEDLAAGRDTLIERVRQDLAVITG